MKNKYVTYAEFEELKRKVDELCKYLTKESTPKSNLSEQAITRIKQKAYKKALKIKEKMEKRHGSKSI